MANKRVSGQVGRCSWLNRSDSGLVGLFGRDRSNPAARVNIIKWRKYDKKRDILFRRFMVR